MSKETKKDSFSNGSGASLQLVIVNPKSAGGSTQARWAEIAADLRAHFGAFQVAFTKKTGDGIELAKRGAAQNRPLIIACGGDGTINEVANGILESGGAVEMGVLPRGTGGDFRRTIGMQLDSREAARQLKTGETKTIDVGRVSFLDHRNEPASRYFVNVSSFGLSAAINERVKSNKLPNWLPFEALKGKAKFAFSTLQEVLDVNFTTVRVRIDGGAESSLNTLNFCVCNARFFGGGMKIAPAAKLADGQLDLVNIGDLRTAKILLNAHKLYLGSHLEMPEVRSTLAKRIEVAAALPGREIFLETDGELPGKLPAVFEIVPQALKIRVPKKS